VNGIKREEKEVVGVRYAGEKRVGGWGGWRGEGGGSTLTRCN
jgi:hypothetical protein